MKCIEPWEEIVGQLRSVQREEGRCILTIGGETIVVSEEEVAAIDARILQPGACVGLLRTDIPGKSLLVRILDGEGAAPGRGKGAAPDEPEDKFVRRAAAHVRN